MGRFAATEMLWGWDVVVGSLQLIDIGIGTSEGHNCIWVVIFGCWFCHKVSLQQEQKVGLQVGL